VLAGLAISLLEITPGNLARSLVASAGRSPSESCRDHFFYPMIDGARNMGRTAMIPITVLAIWVIAGDRWTRKRRTNGG